MIKIDPKDYSLPGLHQHLLGSIAPRPIAFASTVDKEGKPNLSPFSFFNAFGVNPTTLIFSPSRRGRDNTTKHTFENLREVPEVVINVVTYDIVNQMSLASTEYPKGINEFEKAGLTMLPSERIRPFRVKESPVQFECKVREIIETGDQGGAGNLIICEILLMHMQEDILDEKGRIDPHKIKLVGRLGQNYYCKVFDDAVFEVEKPLTKIGIGIDSLPDRIKYSPILSGNELGQLGNIEQLPSEEEIIRARDDQEITMIMEMEFPEEELFHYAQKLIAKGNAYEALKVLLIDLPGTK
jgi:flavin reductase (DIM6/NTAB) family NADH-FMN oxidoreductase RutF